MNTSNVSPLPEGSDAHRVTTMDRRIERNWLRRNWKPFAAVMLMASIGITVAMWPEHGRTFVMDDTRINISRVTTGQFDDFIPVRGRMTPLRTIFLDAVEGGRVEKIHVEDGANVKAGDLLVELSNTTLQLDVISREAQVTEQLNAVLTLELDLERNKLQHKL